MTIIHSFKQQRIFTQSIRDGLQLIYSLRCKNINLLLALFPWIEDHFRAKYQGDIQTIRLVNDRVETIESTVSEVELTVNEVYRWTENIRTLPPPASQPSLAASTSPPPPTFNKTTSIDDLASTFEVKTASKDEDNRSNFNFAISSALAVFGNGNSLPDEVIEYGLRTKRLQSHQITRPLKSATSPEPLSPPSAGNAKKMAGADIEFSPPSFDDDDLLSLA